MPGNRLSVAPMLGWTDRHARYFLRSITRHTRLYTGMITTGTLLHVDARRHLAYHRSEHPLAIQLGGNDPAALAECARLAEEMGYDEVNLNCGCPSNRVRNGGFGACLMADPARVARCVRAMSEAVAIPVTVKTRIGVDNDDSEAALARFVAGTADAGCRTFIIHARKAWLHGLNPAQNRSIPPLRYEVVYRLKSRFPALTIVLNGGVADLDDASRHLREVDGVMIGRAAYRNPYLLAEADNRLFDDPHPIPSRDAVLARLRPYLAAQLAAGVPLQAMARHLHGLFAGQPGARAWRRHLSEHAPRRGADLGVVLAAGEEVFRRGEGL